MGFLRIYLIENNVFFGFCYFYGDDEGFYVDNWCCYALFVWVVLVAMEFLGFVFDIIYCMDWIIGMLFLI